jgi:hypothetical protein
MRRPSSSIAKPWWENVARFGKKSWFQMSKGVKCIEAMFFYDIFLFIAFLKMLKKFIGKLYLYS